MKPERAFVAERAAAQHCPELLRTGPATGDLMLRLGALGKALAKALAAAFAPVMGGEAPTIKAQPARQDEDYLLAAELGSLAANTLYAIGTGATALLVSLDAGAVLALVDRTFGGRGDAPSLLPEVFPKSGDLMIARLEALVCTSLAQALEIGAADAVQVLRRHSNFNAMAPFPAGAPLAAVTLEVSEEGRAPWPIHVTLAESALSDLFSQAAASAKPRRSRADPASEPFAGLPLELSAVLVDMRVPMSALAFLEPGTVLPVAVARNIPIRIGGQLIASGSLGEADDRIAIRITQTFF